MSKLHNQRKHAKRRAFERYGWEVDKHDLRYLVSKIQNGQASHIEKQSNRISKFLVKVNNQDIPVIYDRKRKTIVTFLPNNPV